MRSLIFVALCVHHVLGFSEPKSCKAHPQCNSLAGDCCPSKDNVMLDCCGAQCSAHSECAMLDGYCCPTLDGTMLDCCTNSSGLLASNNTMPPPPEPMLAAGRSEQGAIMNKDGKFLACNGGGCQWAVTPTQVFRKDTGKNGQFRFHILYMDGTDSEQCLDRESCHHGKSKLRMASCDHCGAYHWDHVGAKFGENNMENCIQSDLTDEHAVAHCSQTFAPLQWPVAPDCKVESQTIENVRCTNTNTDGTCAADFQEGSTVGASSHAYCNACNASEGSWTFCEFALSVSKSHTYTTTFSESTAINVEFGVEFQVSAVFANAKTKFSFGVTQTFTTGHETQDAKTYNIESACKSRILPGTSESITVNYMSGTVVGDFTADVKTKWSCPWKDDSTETTVGQITITNVPTQSTTGSCTPVDVPCDGRRLRSPDVLI